MQVPATSSVRLRVGEFEVDLRCGELRRNGDKIKLQQRPFQILAALLQRPGEVVTRDEIRKKLWPSDTFVDFEHGINTAVNKLREALGDDVENPRFIETLPRYGYRLITPVEVVETNGATPEVEAPPAPPQHANTQGPSTQKSRPMVALAAGLITLLAAAAIAIFFFLPRHTATPLRNTWVQITNYSDSATAPALSPDGRMIAFIRGPDTFVTRGELYVKMLPDGEPVQLTHDNLLKMAPAFSPDGSRIAYTTTDPGFGWNTWVVPVLGGEPQKLLPNAAALTWVDRRYVMFSELKTGQNMAIATATESRASERDVYLPTNPVGMAHRSWVSPDGKWILLSEMDGLGWMPCRVLSFDGSTSGEIAGPKKARCTYAGWNPDGKTMYFSADAGDGYHIWRQHFPHGVPEQMTFGPTEEEGVAVSPDGRMLVTSAGIHQSTVWLHDAKGDRQISGEGFATVPGLGPFGGTDKRSVFSPDGKRLFYLVQQPGSRAYVHGELWVTDLDSGGSEAVLPGILMTEFHISPDGEYVAFAAQDAQGIPHGWIAPLDRHTSPKQISSSVSHQLSFGTGGDLYFLARDGDKEFLYCITPGETVPKKVNPQPVVTFVGVSPQGNLLLSGINPTMGSPARGGPATRICDFCGIGWGPDGKLLYLRFRDLGEMGGGRTIAIALPTGRELPILPPSGLKSIDDTKGLNVVADIDMSGKVIFAPGPDPSIYAYTRMTVQRNLYGIPLK
ncbi:MAG: winged helix-turn-helix domain-containing protein [Alloacidobacterium sp.]|jgi:DNA-binding winged helix-turn-helix (wHTH) protein/Tol biopolymer transport system component